MATTRYTHPSGLNLSESEAFKLHHPGLNDTVSYPPGWLKAATAAEIAALGFTQVITPDPVIDPLTVPLTRRQLRLGLLNLGATWGAVKSAAAASGTPAQKEAALIAVEESDSYHRDHPLFSSLPPQLGLTDAMIDAEWAKAVNY